MTRSELVAIRNATVNDKNFIFASFLRGLYYGDSWFSNIDKDSFMHNYHRFIENLLATPGVSIKIACLKEDQDVILGYCISRGSKLDFIFIKKAWRKIGIAKSLIPDTVSVVTHATKVGLIILKKKGWKFDPFT